MKIKELLGKYPKRTSYETERELSFIRGALGFSSHHTKDIPRKEMLLRYSRAIRKRKRWGSIDQIAVLAEVNRLYIRAAAASISSSNKVEVAG